MNYPESWKHQIYTPFKSTVVNKILHDRPFAGLLYAQLGISKTFKNNSILRNSFLVGVVGKSAFGQELQEAIHEIYNFKNHLWAQNKVIVDLKSG